MNNQSEQTNTLTEIFGEPIYTYSRAQAVADGVQFEVPSATAREAGFTVPVYLTDAVFSKYVEVPAGVEGQDVDGRLWDILWMLRAGIRSSKTGGARLLFSLYVRNTNRRPKLVTLAAEMGPRDHDDPAAALTVMLPTED